VQNIAKQVYIDIQTNELIRARSAIALLGRLNETEKYYHLSCLLHIKAGDWEKTEALLKAGMQKYPGSHSLAIQRIKFLKRRYELKGIIRFAKIFQQNYGAHYGVAIQEAIAQLASGRYNEGLFVLKPYLDGHAKAPADQLLQVRIIYGLCLRRLKKWKPAEEQLTLAFDAGMLSAGIHLANLQFETQRPTCALALFEALLNSSQEVYAYMGICHVLTSFGQSKEAEKMLKKALACQPALLPALCDYANINLPTETSMDKQYRELSCRTKLFEELGNSLFWADGMIWRLWPRNGERRA
jgi:tetratricopeptide (TPR) repeat protein